MDKCREQFEEWAGKQRFNTERLNDCNSNECKWYANAATDMLWDAWQASRQALVVELPEVFDAAKDDAAYYEYAYHKDDVEKALDSAGVEYK